VQDGAAPVHLEVDRGLAEVKRPEQARRQNAAVEIVQLRPRPGVEQVDSYQGERSVPDRAVRDVLAFERADVRFEIVGLAVASAGAADVESEGREPVEVSNR
jgi:hypothetical protein